MKAGKQESGQSGKQCSAEFSWSIPHRNADGMQSRCRSMPMKKLFMLMLFLPALTSAGEMWGNLNLTSYHTKPKQNLNRDNFGAGVEYHANGDVMFMLGAYQNSYNRTSVYALAGWAPLDIGPIQVGAVVGAINGYPGLNNGDMTQAIAGIFRIEGERIGMNVLVIPPALKEPSITIGVQLKYKF